MSGQEAPRPAIVQQPVQRRKHWNERAETLQADELRDVQERRILSIVGYVYHHSALHRRVWEEAGLEPGDIRSLGDFQTKVPCFDKEMVRDYREESGDRFGGLLCVPQEHCLVAQSSGTTGEATFSAFTLRDLDVLTELWCRAQWAFGPDEEGLRPGETCLMTVDTPHSYMMPMTNSILRIGAAALMGSHEPSAMKTYQYLKHFTVHRCFFSTYALINGLRERADQDGMSLRELFAGMRSLGLSGEVITPAFQERVVDETGVYVMNTGGSTPEVGTVWTECAAHKGFVHMHGQDIYMSEVTDPITGLPVGPGEIGEHTVTAFSLEGMPVLRFKTDDLVEALPSGPCEYGRTSLRLRFHGRKSDQIEIGGKRVFVSQVKATLEKIAGGEDGHFQIVRTDSMNLVRLRVGCVSDRGLDLEALTVRIKAAFKKELGIEVEPEYVSVQSLLSLHPWKYPRITRE